MSELSAALKVARYRAAKIVLAAGVAVTLAWGPGGWLAPAGVAKASPRLTAGGVQLAAWAQTGSVPVGGFFALAVNPATSAVYFENPDSDALSVLNAQTGQVMGSIAMPNVPTAAAVNPTTGII